MSEGQNTQTIVGPISRTLVILPNQMLFTSDQSQLATRAPAPHPALLLEDPEVLLTSKHRSISKSQYSFITGLSDLLVQPHQPDFHYPSTSGSR